jgi:two-component system, OmpR family, heavy metal sensor histidine kinase CusS
MIRASIRVRLVAWYLVVLSTGMLLLGSVVWILLRHALLESLDESLMSRKASFVRFLEKESHGTHLAAIREEAREYSTGLPSGHSLRVWAPDGRLLFAASNPESAQRGNQRLKKEETSVFGQRLSIEFGESLEEVDETLSLLQTILLSCIPLVLIVSTAGGWWISSRALRPVDALTAAAEAISVRDLSRRLPVPGAGDELQRLAEAWNRMLDRIAASVQQMKRFTTDAAHELRTPVTIVSCTAELALRRERDAASYRTALSGIQEETINLTRLLEELMWLARNDVGALGLNREDVSVEDLVSDVFRAAFPLAENRGILLQVQYEGGTNQTMRCDRRATRRCLLILLDNAIKFTPPGGSIRIRFVSQAGTCRIEVHDTGNGVAEEHLPHIFDRFYQADESRTISGFGLGWARRSESRPNAARKVDHLRA